MQRAQELRERGGKERFVWTTGSWLIYEYLERADAQNRGRMEQAITNGDIRWHGLPFTTHTESMTPELFRAGLGISQELDQRFGVKTIAAKMTDVPGHTRSIIPLMAEAGLKFLHIGVNPASRTPDVPDVFRWRDTTSGEEIMVMYHKGSYGCTMQVSGMKDAIHFSHTADNAGPQSMENLLNEYARLQDKFPDMEICGSTMDAFAVELEKIKGDFPVIEQELGDNWIHGIGTDPAKLAKFRALCRLHKKWQQNKINNIGAFERKLMMIPEHTWGLDIKTHLGDYVNYPRAQFEAARNHNIIDFQIPEEISYAYVVLKEGERSYQQVEASWTEQRNYLNQAVAALPANLEKEANTALNVLTPAKPDIAGIEWKNVGEEIEAGKFIVAVNKNGALCKLSDDASEFNLAGQLSYQSFSANDYQNYLENYNINLDNPDVYLWAVPDFSKPGLKPENSPSKTYLPTLQRVGIKQEDDSDTVVVELSFNAEEHQRLGAPKTAWIEYVFPKNKTEIEIRLQWFNKPANRMPEALWYSFCPALKEPENWTIDKMGKPVSPLDVIKDGNRNLHGFDQGINYSDSDINIEIESLDAGLVAPGRPRLMEFDNSQPDINGGMHFNLYNNKWGTNFPMWYEEDAVFRFNVKIN